MGIVASILLVVVVVLVRRYFAGATPIPRERAPADKVPILARGLYSLVMVLIVLSPLLAFYTSRRFFSDRWIDSAWFALIGVYALLPASIGALVTRAAGEQAHDSYWWLLRNRGRFSRAQVLSTAACIALSVAILTLLAALA
jgi:hypothetical protein